MKKIKKILEKYVEKKLEIEIEGETTNLCIINWEEIVADDLAEFNKTKSMTEIEKNEFWNNKPKGPMEEIIEYFIVDSEFEQKVDDKEWIPFGLLGLMHNAHIYGFAEMNNDGLLLFDVSDGKEDQPEIILIVDGEESTIAENFKELTITKVE